MLRVIDELSNVCRAWLKLKLGAVFCRGQLSGKMLARVGKDSVFRVRKNSKITTQVGLKVGKRVTLSALNGGILAVGRNVGIGDNCHIVAHESVSISDGTMLGPNVFIYDHDHDFRAGLGNMQYKTKPVSIGKNCWVGANTVILRGTVLGDNCVVGAGCVLNGEYKAGSLIIQKRQTTVEGDAT